MPDKSSDEGTPKRAKRTTKKTTAKKAVTKKTATTKKKTTAKKTTTAKKKKTTTAKPAAQSAPAPKTTKAPTAGRRLRVRQVRSGIGRRVDFRRTLRALGLKHHQGEVVVTSSPAVDGMLRKVSHLVTVTPEE